MGRGGFYPKLKRKEREADYSPLSSAKVKSDWSFTFSTPISFNDAMFMETKAGKKNEVRRISKQPSALQIMTDQK